MHRKFTICWESDTDGRFVWNFGIFRVRIWEWEQVGDF